MGDIGLVRRNQESLQICDIDLFNSYANFQSFGGRLAALKHQVVVELLQDRIREYADCLAGGRVGKPVAVQLCDRP
jgi:hypothetical protein